RDVTAEREPVLTTPPTTPQRRKRRAERPRHEQLLVPVMRDGHRTAPSPSVHEIRARAKAELASFDPAVLRRVNPHAYPAGLESALHARRDALIETVLASERQVPTPS